MLVEARRLHPQAPGVAADFEELPFRTGSFGGIWANKCLQHVDPGALPLVLGELRRVLDVGGRLGLLVFAGEGEATSDDDLPGRYFAWWDPERLADVVAGAGFGVDEVAVTGTESAPIALTATRLRSLPDTVAPGMRLLVCGLNPSLYSADAGVPFARTGNRFWRALAAAGLDDVDRDPTRPVGAPPGGPHRHRQARHRRRSRASMPTSTAPAWRGSTASRPGSAPRRSASSAWRAGGPPSTGRPARDGSPNHSAVCPPT